MARRKSTLLAGSVLALAAPLWTGCTDDSVSLRVQCNVAPEPGDDACEISADGICLAEGRLNVALATYYQGAVVLTSGLVTRENDIPLQAETNNVTITEFEVDVLRSSGERIKFNGLPNPFRLPTSGYVPVGQTGLATGDFLPSPYVAQIAAAEMGAQPLGLVIASVTVRGKTQGEVEVEAGAFRWPIRLFQVDPSDPTQCKVYDTAVCNFGQDAFVDACLDQSQE